MADPDHHLILLQGVAVWNHWRKQNPDIRPDLRWADLSELDLTGVDLSKVILTGADLSGAHLSGANLSDAFLEGAVFNGSWYDKTTTWPSPFAPAAHGAILL